jgi:hypothetical protein
MKGVAMRTHQVPALPMVTQIPVPTDARGLATLGRIDYADAFRVDVGGALDRSGERWARATLVDAPLMVRAKLVCGWSGLGLRLGSPWSPRRVLGWEVRRSRPDSVLLGARSWLGMPGELLFRPEPHGLLFATFVQQDTPLAGALWARVTPTHQRVVRSLLTHAARRALAIRFSGRRRSRGRPARRRPGPGN